MSLVVVLICLLSVSGICVCLLKRMNKLTENEVGCRVNAWNQRRRNSVPIDDAALSSNEHISLSPQHVAIDSRLVKKLELDSMGSSVKRSKIKNENKSRNEMNVSVSSSVSPFGSYYDGNVKSVVYDRIIEPWNLEDDMDAI